MQKNMKKGWFILLFITVAFVMIPIIIGILQHNKALPKHISYESPSYETTDVKLLYDVTYEKNGRQQLEQQLQSEAFKIIIEAEQFLVVDLFLYNDEYDRAKGEYPKAAAQFTNVLLKKRMLSPDMPITVITDGVNELYGAASNPFFEQLRKHHIDVVLTNTEPLRDSNPIYSSIWRSYLKWWPVAEDGFLPNAFNPDGQNGSLGGYFNMLNFKANHRKIVMNESRALITSANLTHDGSSFHSNIGFVVEGEILKELYESERAVAALSNHTLANPQFLEKEEEVGDKLHVKLVTERKIKDELLQAISGAQQLQIGVFYLADRDIVKALKEASRRGANVQLLLDPNKDAFGLEKNGIPNRQTAAELSREDNITVRFYDTNGEQFHSKFLYAENDTQAQLIGGSANFTRRNIEDYNLESNIAITMPKDAQLAQDFRAYYARMWHNKDGQYTVDYAHYQDSSLWKKLVYRFQEWTGLSTF